MTNYEYSILRKQGLDGPKGLEVLINKMTEDGWEPVNITCDNPYRGSTFYICLLKRISRKAVMKLDE